MSTRKEQLLRRAAGKKGRRVALTREEKSLRDFLEKMSETSGYKIKDFSHFCYKGARVDDIANMDTSNATNFNNMFYECKTLTSVPELDTRNGTDFNGMFRNCQKLLSVPKLDTSNGSNFDHMFNSCYALTSVPELDTRNGTSFGSMFSTCQKLLSVPELDTRNGRSLNSMFNYCSALTSVPKLDVGSCTNFSSMFNQCSSLETLRLYNIRTYIAIGSSAWGTRLTVDSLVHTIQELCTVESSKTLTMGSANLAKIAGLYCKITDDTVEKKTMELCESTDEGAMTLADYASLKGWKFA